MILMFLNKVFVYPFLVYVCVCVHALSTICKLPFFYANNAVDGAQNMFWNRVTVCTSHNDYIPSNAAGGARASQNVHSSSKQFSVIQNRKMSGQSVRLRITKLLKVVILSLLFVITVLILVATVRTISLDVNTGLKLARWERTEHVPPNITSEYRQRLVSNFKGKLTARAGSLNYMWPIMTEYSFGEKALVGNSNSRKYEMMAVISWQFSNHVKTVAFSLFALLTVISLCWSHITWYNCSVN